LEIADARAGVLRFPGTADDEVARAELTENPGQRRSRSNRPRRHRIEIGILIAFSGSAEENGPDSDPVGPM
jgi:hypothetical protein